MTAVPLLTAHKGCHCQRREPSRLALFFRSALRRVLGKPAAPEGLLVPSGAGATGTATALLTPPDGTPVLEDRWVSDVRAERAARHASLMHAGYASAVDRLRREAGLPTVAQMNAMSARSPFPPLDEPAWPEPTPRGPVHDTRMDVYAPHYAPDVAAPVYGEKPQLVVEPELARRVIA